MMTPLFDSKPRRLPHLKYARSQINGAALQGMSSEDFSDVAPSATRVIGKLLLQSVRDLQAAAAMTSQSKFHELSSEYE